METLIPQVLCLCGLAFILPGAKEFLIKVLRKMIFCVILEIFSMKLEVANTK